MNKKAVIYGGGNIGRGFVGQLFYESGYDITFIDINKELINQINEKRGYQIKFTDNSPGALIKNIRGVYGDNYTEIANAIAEADIMAVSVGANILKFIMQPVAEGINKRFADKNFMPFNIILCENLIGGDKIMRDGVRGHINFVDLYDEKIGFVEASVGRVVPNQTEEMKAGNMLGIVAESYKFMPVDKDGFKGAIPDIKNMTAYSPFRYFIERKLYIYNMGHAVCAYLGDISGYDYIWQAVQDSYIELIVSKIMQRTAFALSKKYQADIIDLNAYIENLIYRFADKALGDTVKRVGNDLKRKLSPNDRIIGAYKICLETGVPVQYLCLAIAAAVNFKGDKLSGESLENILKEAGSFDLMTVNDFVLMKKYDNIIKSAGVQELFHAVKSDENIVNAGK